MRDDFVRVRAPARLHLGFLDPGGNGERRFGGIGLAIDAPSTTLTVARAAQDRFEGFERRRTEVYLDMIRARLGRHDRHYSVTVEEAIPAHSGLGSGTQLSLSLAAGLRALEGLPNDPAGDATALGRGNRSGLGAAFMASGGLAVDGGKGLDDSPPPIVAQIDFPEEWRVILVMDRREEGFHGTSELDAFARLPSFPAPATDRICRLVLMRALPGIAERDIDSFGSAIAEIQEIVGGHFAPAQGGVFASERVGAACSTLAVRGAHGIGQSSWGPTGFCFAGSQIEAENLVAGVAAAGLADGLDLAIVCGRNHGATIVREARETTEQRTGTR